MSHGEEDRGWKPEAIEERKLLDIAAVIANGRLYSAEALEVQLGEFERFFRDSAYARAAEAGVRALFPGVEAR